MDAGWQCNECIEMHVCKLSMSLEELKFNKLVSMLQNSSRLASICEVMNALEKLLKIKLILVAKVMAWFGVSFGINNGSDFSTY